MANNKQKRSFTHSVKKEKTEGGRENVHYANDIFVDLHFKSNREVDTTNDTISNTINYRINS